MPERIDRIAPKYLVLGEILRPHGIRGEVRMRVHCDDPQQLQRLDAVYVGKSAHDQRPRQLNLNNLRFNRQYALLKFAGYDSRGQADALRGLLVMIDIDSAPPLAEGEYFLFQLIGLTVVADDQEIGLVREVMQTGANDVYVVASERHGDVLIPAHDDTILRIDFEAGRIDMSLPEGLLPGD